MKLLTRTEEILLISIWRLEDNAYGVTIRDKVLELTRKEWSLGQIYVPLDKLTRKGFITKTLSDPTSQRGGRSKCMYRLSPAGETALRDVRAVQEALWGDLPQIAFE